MKLNKQVVILGITILCIGLVFLLLKYVRFSGEPVELQISALKISSVIVSHHDLASAQRSALISEVVANSNISSIKTIILVSTDHFLAADSPIVTTDKEWKLANAVILPDKTKIQELIDSSQVSNQESAFNREHGITNILADISNSFSNARLIPLMIRQDASQEKVSQLNDELVKVCSENCLLISSVDFSHYQPGTLAEIHDSLSIRALNNLDKEAVYRSEVDSPQALALAIMWAKTHETRSFKLKEETNSGKLLGEPDSESTSYVLGWYQNGKISKINEATFMLGGDMMFGRYIAYKFRSDLTNSVRNLGDRLFWGTDVSMVNLEGLISASLVPFNLDLENLVFNFPRETTNVLKWLHLDAVSLANNHSLNAGISGLENTKKVLLENNIAAIGDQTHLGFQEFGQDQKITIFTLNTSLVSIDLSSQIAESKSKGNFVIVFPHWGNEYQRTHSAAQSKLAHQWIDAGADLVVGSHPHVIQDAEIYKGKPIFYSLGNLLFDQSFSKETQRGLVLAGKITADTLQLVFLPIQIKNYQPELLRGDEKLSIINSLKSDLGIEISSNSYGYDMIELSR